MSKVSYYVRLSALTVPLPLLLALSLSGCVEGNGNQPSPLCGNDVRDDFILSGTSQLFSPPLVPTNAYLSGGAANFDWDHEVDGLCSLGPDGNNYVDFNVSAYLTVTDFSFVGRVYAAALIQPYTSPLVGSGDNINGTVGSIGLKQSHPDGSPANIVVELHLSFPSSGDLNADVARAKAAMNHIEITSHFSLAK